MKRLYFKELRKIFLPPYQRRDTEWVRNHEEAFF